MIKDGIMIMEKSATTILELLPLTIIGSLLSERFKEKRLRILTDFDVRKYVKKAYREMHLLMWKNIAEKERKNSITLHHIISSRKFFSKVLGNFNMYFTSGRFYVIHGVSV